MACRVTSRHYIFSAGEFWHGSKSAGHITEGGLGQVIEAVSTADHAHTAAFLPGLSAQQRFRMVLFFDTFGDGDHVVMRARARRTASNKIHTIKDVPRQ